MVSWLPAGNQRVGRLEDKVKDTPTPTRVLGTGFRYCALSLLRYPYFLPIFLCYCLEDFIILLNVNPILHYFHSLALSIHYVVSTLCIPHLGLSNAIYYKRLGYTTIWRGPSQEYASNNPWWTKALTIQMGKFDEYSLRAHLGTHTSHYFAYSLICFLHNICTARSLRMAGVKVNF
jgi:hypothetical protein